jgi:hypothetical protein
VLKLGFDKGMALRAPRSVAGSRQERHALRIRGSSHPSHNVFQKSRSMSRLQPAKNTAGETSKRSFPVEKVHFRP